MSWTAEVSACQRIAENNRIITDFQKGTVSSLDRLLEKILQLTNLNNAYKLKDGKYKPNPVQSTG